MSEQTFKGLMEYSSTFPMWKARRGDKWFLAWYYPDKDPVYIGIEWREILILN
ncbi:hypothetical protein [uncultured Parabacteroides sp.]|uniref:hypothetical protein n=1 Tax=uncultured Parabacteroides sp. TaxID=512312 RepID=UPI00267488E1|nr:hypothetical protein [uncultured Parabacteroides sp.]